MSDKKGSIRDDIAKAMAQTYRPFGIPEGGRRDTLEYGPSGPRAKFRTMPLAQSSSAAQVASKGAARPFSKRMPGATTDRDMAMVKRAYSARKPGKI